ncbi:hypothetical protein LO749_13800 [Paracoccus denitrificans]|uniref:hypothetical protein n=1 Tax=Paracoccus denitrificans TaxID=266 RepID=UPI001E45083E|nr:hypothetical protein [Paracoccus denitrificans]UFS67195.1 hypothetical protein LO749_13800 [Paracoccus denitrificans]
MAAPFQQKLTVEVAQKNCPATTSKPADQAIRALARIIGRQIAREQFRKQQSIEADDQ